MQRSVGRVGAQLMNGLCHSIEKKILICKLIKFLWFECLMSLNWRNSFATTNLRSATLWKTFVRLVASQLKLHTWAMLLSIWMMMLIRFAGNHCSHRSRLTQTNPSNIHTHSGLRSASGDKPIVGIDLAWRASRRLSGNLLSPSEKSSFVPNRSLVTPFQSHPIFSIRSQIRLNQFKSGTAQSNRRRENKPKKSKTNRYLWILYSTKSRYNPANARSMGESGLRAVLIAQSNY